MGALKLRSRFTFIAAIVTQTIVATINSITMASAYRVHLYCGFWSDIPSILSRGFFFTIHFTGASRG
jgi:hypothetical protein